MQPLFDSSSGIVYSDESSIPLTLLSSRSIIVICAQLLLPNSIAILKCYSYPHWHKLLDTIAMDTRIIPGTFQLTNLRNFFTVLLVLSWYFVVCCLASLLLLSEPILDFYCVLTSFSLFPDQNSWFFLPYQVLHSAKVIFHQINDRTLTD